jgi:parallel beta helix pectate lyase-like protein
MNAKTFLLTLSCAVVFHGLANGQPAQRTFVSSATGVDANPCSRARPCRNFAAALGQTLAGGEIIVLDSGGYGQVTINKAVQIQAVGVYAGVTAASGVAITIASGASDQVVLRGLTINGVGALSGIFFSSGASLHIDRCQITGFFHNGVLIDASAVATVFVKDSVFRGDSFGLAARNLGSSITRVSVDHCRFVDNGVVGLAALQNSQVSVRNSVAEHGSGGFWAEAFEAGATAALFLESCRSASNIDGISIGSGNAGTAFATISNSEVVNNSSSGVFVGLTGTAYISRTVVAHNGTGIDADAATAFARVSDSTITRNNTGITGPGTVLSRTPAGNTLEGNTNDGSFTGTFAAE